MNGIVISGGRVIDPAHGLDRETDLFIVDGRVAALDQAPAGFAASVEIDAREKWVCPGLIDLATQPREPGQTQKASISSEAKAAAAGGITSFCCQPNTDPVVDLPTVVELLRRRSEEATAARLLPLGALTQNLSGEKLSAMAALRDAGCVAMSDGGRPVVNSQVLRRALEYADTFEITVILTPRDPWLSEGGLAHEGAVSTRLGLIGIPEAAETAALARDLALVEQTGTRTHFGRLSTARSVELIAQALDAGLPVSADVAAHQLFLTELDLWDFNHDAYVQPPLRTVTDREALRRGVASGAIGVICSDHQPHDPDAKSGPLAAIEPGISGLDSLLALVLRLVDEGLLKLPQALATVTCNPARVLGIDRGHLAPGAQADICVIDPHAVWRLEGANIRSRGRNTPFRGWEFTGRATHTLVDGRLVFSLDHAG